jgi:hypothetical protein
MKVIRVLGSEKCYEFEDGEKVPFANKKRYIEKRYGNAGKNRPAEYKKADTTPRADGAIHTVGSGEAPGGDDKAMGQVGRGGRPSVKTDGIKPRVRKKKSRKRKNPGA